MVLRLVRIGIIEVGAGRFIGFDQFFGSVNAQRIPMAVKIANDGSGLVWPRLHFVGNLEVAGSRLGDIGSDALFEACFGSLARFVGVIAAATLQHSSSVKKCQREGGAEGNVFHAPKNGMLTKGGHSLNNMMFSH